MTPESGTPEGIALTHRLMRHVVAIYFDFLLNGVRKQFVHSAFLLSVEGRWLLMTAGHCITDITELRSQGWILTQCLLADFLGENAVYEQPVPFAYDAAYPMHIGVNERIDYGVLIPPDNTCQLLAANNIEPFDEDSWDAEPGEIKDYFLLGFPAQLNVLKGNQFPLRASMFHIARHAERPEDFPEEDPPIYFYGRVIESPLDTLKGCSGGPVVSLSPPDSEGTARYHLVAMLVTSMGRDIKGMLMPPLGQLVRDLLRQRYERDA